MRSSIGWREEEEDPSSDDSSLKNAPPAHRYAEWRATSHRRLERIPLRVRDNGVVSWDIFVQQIPEDVRHVGDIPSDFVPGPLGPRAEIVAGIRDVFPTVDFSDPEWGRVEEDGFSIEINMDAEDPVTSFALHARGDGVAPAIAALLDRLGLRAFDPQSATGLFDPETSAQSHDAWRRYRDQAVEPERRSADPEN